MSSTHYFQFLSAVWDQLPEADRERFGELWQGYEQVLAAVYQKYSELNLNAAVADMEPYTTERWLPYTFGTSNFISRPATITSTQDMSAGLNLVKRYLLKFRIDGGTPFEVNVQGNKPQTTLIDEVVAKINLAAGFPFASSLYSNTILFLKSRTSGVNSSIEVLPTSNPYANACEFVLGISLLEIPKTYPQYRYPYTMPYSRVASIPEFRDAVREESTGVRLIEGTDYIVEDSQTVVSFREIPPENLWAVRSRIDEENPWANFGFLTEIYQKNSPRYVGIIQGLWFALWNGPKPYNVRISLYLLFGLPTAPENSVVSGLTSEVITLTGVSGSIYTFDIPTGLSAEVALGQSVNKFTPLVDGIWVYDKINAPGFIEREAGREGIQRFLTEDATRGFGTPENPTDEDRALKMLEEYTFLPQISVDSFIYPDINLRNIRTFLDSFKPLNKTYLFQVIVGNFRELLGLDDRLGMLIDIDLTSNLEANEANCQWKYTGVQGPEDPNRWVCSDIPYFDDSYSGHDYDALNIDPHGILFEEQLQIEVRSFGSLIDSFTA